MRGTPIDYDAVRSKLSTVDYAPLVARLRRILPSVWLKAYRKMAQAPIHVLGFSDHGYEFLFDHASELIGRSEAAASAAEDRIIVAFGQANGIGARHNGSRANGLLGSAATILGGGVSRDHIPGRVLGGALDLCLFPQRRDLSREWSGDGRTYRAMERYCIEHPGTFTFSRPIYDSVSWWPCEIEHGLLRIDGTFWVEQFENASQARVPFLPGIRARAAAG